MHEKLIALVLMITFVPAHRKFSDSIERLLQVFIMGTLGIKYRCVSVHMCIWGDSSIEILDDQLENC